MLAFLSFVLTGAKNGPAHPVMIYNTGSVASPHAVVLDKDQAVLNKASITQHVQTPYAQYTYTHAL